MAGVQFVPSAQVLAAIRTLRGLGWAGHAIATELGIDPQTLRRVMRDNGIPTGPLPPSEGKMRKCLMHGGEFMSHHIGERVCERCKSSSTWRSGADYGLAGSGGRVPARSGT